MPKMQWDDRLHAPVKFGEGLNRNSVAVSPRSNPTRLSRLLANRVDNPNPFAPRQVQTFRYGAPPPVLTGVTTPLPTLSFRISPYRQSSYRTPIEQAQEVAAKRSFVCWGAHMSNKARHILPRVDGKDVVEGDDFELLLAQHLPWFKGLWSRELLICGLRDAAGGTTWFKGKSATDQLHVELPGAKFGQDDARAAACVDEYARLRQVENMSPNPDFEQALRPHLQGVLMRALAKYKVKG